MKFVFSQSIISVVLQKWARTGTLSERLADLVHFGQIVLKLIDKSSVASGLL